MIAIDFTVLVWIGSWWLVLWNGVMLALYTKLVGMLRSLLLLSFIKYSEIFLIISCDFILLHVAVWHKSSRNVLKLLTEMLESETDAKVSLKLIHPFGFKTDKTALIFCRQVTNRYSFVAHRSSLPTDLPV